VVAQPFSDEKKFSGGSFFYLAENICYWWYGALVIGFPKGRREDKTETWHL